MQQNAVIFDANFKAWVKKKKAFAVTLLSFNSCSFLHFKELFNELNCNFS